MNNLSFLLQPFKNDLFRLNQREHFITVLGRELQDLPESKAIQSLALGEEHLLLLLSKKEVLGFGNNAFGQLSLPALSSGVQAIDCGCEHSGVLTEQKELFLFGLDLYGALGPRTLNAVDHFALGGYFSVVV